jgi:hypothetical protein
MKDRKNPGKTQVLTMGTKDWIPERLPVRSKSCKKKKLRKRQRAFLAQQRPA